MPNTMTWIIITVALIAGALFFAGMYVDSYADKKKKNLSSDSESPTDEKVTDSDIDDVLTSPHDERSYTYSDLKIWDDPSPASESDDASESDPEDDIVIYPETDPDDENEYIPSDEDSLEDKIQGLAMSFEFDEVANDEEDAADTEDAEDAEALSDGYEYDDQDEDDDDCPMIGLSWSQSAFTANDSFSFNIITDKKGHFMSGFACSAKGTISDFERVRLSDDEWNEMERLLDESDIEEWEAPKDDNALTDATVVTFELIFADLSTIRVFPPDKDTCDKIMGILLKAANVD